MSCHAPGNFSRRGQQFDIVVEDNKESRGAADLICSILLAWAMSRARAWLDEPDLV
jgi:hypothetical protein